MTSDDDSGKAVLVNYLETQFPDLLQQREGRAMLIRLMRDSSQEALPDDALLDYWLQIPGLTLMDICQPDLAGWK